MRIQLLAFQTSAVTCNQEHPCCVSWSPSQKLCNRPADLNRQVSTLVNTFPSSRWLFLLFFLINMHLTSPPPTCCLLFCELQSSMPQNNNRQTWLQRTLGNYVQKPSTITQDSHTGYSSRRWRVKLNPYFTN